jgi:hypothetical protein
MTSAAQMHANVLKSILLTEKLFYLSQTLSGFACFENEVCVPQLKKSHGSK